MRPDDVVQELQVREPKVGFDGVDLCLVAGFEDIINVRDDGLDVCGAVLGHVLLDWGVVLPEIANSLELLAIIF